MKRFFLLFILPFWLWSCDDTASQNPIEYSEELILRYEGMEQGKRYLRQLNAPYIYVYDYQNGVESPAGVEDDRNYLALSIEDGSILDTLSYEDQNWICQKAARAVWSSMEYPGEYEEFWIEAYHSDDYHDATIFTYTAEDLKLAPRLRNRTREFSDYENPYDSQDFVD